MTRQDRDTIVQALLAYAAAIRSGVREDSAAWPAIEARAAEVRALADRVEQWT